MNGPSRKVADFRKGVNQTEENRPASPRHCVIALISFSIPLFLLASCESKSGKEAQPPQVQPTAKSHDAKATETAVPTETKVSAGTLHFPADRSMGTLKVYDQEKGTWSDMGEAKGEVEPPPGKEILLAVNPDAVADLSPLEGIGPAGVQKLVMDGLKIGDQQLAHLKAVHALKKMSLRGAEITDSGMAGLEGLNDLEELDLGLTSIGDAGLVHLKSLPNLSVLDVSSTQVTDASLPTLKAMRKLQYLDPQRTGITAKGIEELNETLPTCVVVVR